ncbi:site-specific integrase [Magnetospirillum fulvum]|uniref:Integrase n=1 Tax=Magnetospirillum fulvum MGU-K5 TaxID=1316936 RepID=S9SE21_MAGFU|nr:site-specific integrase [Magnetospirillum fulvum]EPY02318.1 integrase [Magnetospirillum fulvum MGU-K5]
MSHPDLTPDQIDELARTWFANALDIDEEDRLHLRPGKAMYTGCGDDDPVEADLEVLSFLDGDFREAIAHNDFRLVQGHVEELLTNAGIAIDRKSETFRRLARGLLRANIEFIRIAKARRVGNYAVTPQDPLFSIPPAVASTASTPPDPALSSTPLPDLVRLYTAAQEKDGKWTADTQRKTVPKLVRFAETLDNKPVDMVTRDDVRSWRRSLEESDLANNTIRLHFKAVAAMFNWARTEKVATIDNPTKGLMPPEDEPKRDAFTPEELKTLFASPLYTGHWRADRRERPGKVLVKDFKYWFPLIGLHTGMRVEEIAKLRVEDVRQEDGGWCFDIKKAKTKAGERLVPIHPRLIDLGFLDHVRSVKHERLWPELTADAEGDYSSAFCKWFPWYRSAIGIDREGLVFHSFRHLFTSYLLNVHGVEERMVSFLVGHQVKSMTGGRYGNKLITARMKLDLFKDADFGVDLSHLLAGRNAN